MASGLWWFEQGDNEVHSECENVAAAPTWGSLRDLIIEGARTAPDSCAITAPGRTPLSYRALLEQVDRTFAALRAMGVSRNDRVALVLDNGPEAATAFLATACACVSAPLNPAYGKQEFEFFLEDLTARALIVERGVESPAREVARRLGVAVVEIDREVRGAAGVFTIASSESRTTAGDDPAGSGDTALVLHTSGTTSRPKVVPLTHGNLLASARNVAVTLALSHADCCLNIMPLFHIHGIVAALLASLEAGASVIATPGFYAPQFFEWLDECAPTWYTAVPTMHQAILARSGAEGPVIARRGLRLIRSSSSALMPQVMADLERIFNCPVIEAYGMTEAAHQMSSNPLPPKVRKPGSVGPAAGPEIAIMDVAGRLLDQGEAGEVVIRGSNVTPGYEGNPEANAAAWVEGWFRTGDQGYLDSDGYLVLTGRIKEIINRGGEKIAPREVDEVLMTHPSVAQAVTFSMPDLQLGEDVAAAVVLREGTMATESEIREHVAGRLAMFKAPRRVIFVDEIPKGPTGKLQRIGLAQKLDISREPVTDPGEFVAPRTPVEETLATICMEVLKADRVGIHDDFFQIGGDSMLATLVVTRVRNAFAVDLPLLAFFEKPTVADIAVEVIFLKALQAGYDIEGLLDEIEAQSS